MIYNNDVKFHYKFNFFTKIIKNIFYLKHFFTILFIIAKISIIKKKKLYEKRLKFKNINLFRNNSKFL